MCHFEFFNWKLNLPQIIWMKTIFFASVWFNLEIYDFQPWYSHLTPGLERLHSMILQKKKNKMNNSVPHSNQSWQRFIILTGVVLCRHRKIFDYSNLIYHQTYVQHTVSSNQNTAACIYACGTTREKFTETSLKLFERSITLA